MKHRYDRYLTPEQASEALNIDIGQVLAMLGSGELRNVSSGSETPPRVSFTDVQLIRRRLESLRRLDGDQQ